MKRPLVFALELFVAAAISVVVGWVANRFSHKENRQAQAFERIASAVEQAGACR